MESRNKTMQCRSKKIIENLRCKETKSFAYSCIDYIRRFMFRLAIQTPEFAMFYQVEKTTAPYD